MNPETALKILEGDALDELRFSKRQAVKSLAAEVRRLTVLRPMEEAPRDGTTILVCGIQFDGEYAVVRFDEDWGKYGWWQMDDGKNYEIPMRGDESHLKGWLPLPTPTSAEG